MSSTEVLYLGTAFPSKYVHAGDRFRLAIRNVPSLMGSVFLVSFDARVKKLLEVLPGGSGVAYAFPPATTDLAAGVAVIDVAALSTLEFGLTAAGFAQHIGQAMSGMEVFRLTGLEGAQSPQQAADGRAAELAVAVQGDKALDAVEAKESLLGKTKDAAGKLLETGQSIGRWFLVVLFALIALGMVYLLRGSRSGS